MVNMKELEWAIDELEREESSFKNYSILADLYTVRANNYIVRANNTQQESAIDTYAIPQAASYRAMEGTEVVGDYGESEFLQIARGRDAASAWQIVDELMDTLKVVNRKVYESVIRKLETV